MSTPLTRARTALRVVNAFKASLRNDLEQGDVPETQGEGNTLPALLPQLSSVRRQQSLPSSPLTVADDDAREPLVHNNSMAYSTAPDSAGGVGFFAPVSDAKAIAGLITSSWLNILLLSVPLGIAAELLKWPAMWRFGLNFLALVPLALLLGEVTEDLALRFGDVIGGLLNATFGNIVELILSLAALQKGLVDVVAASLIGSVLSNLLLVLGCCFLVGGTQFHQQRFNVSMNKVMCSLLFLACIALALPTAGRVLWDKHTITDDAIQQTSHVIAILLIFAYCCYLFFQLKTHRAESSEAETEAADGGEKAEGAEAATLSLSGALATLTAITVIVAFASEFLTGSIEEVSEGSGINKSFLGLIVLPIAGNACEHITAVFVAAKNKMDLALGVALGSSIQIALFVMPCAVIVGWITHHPFSLALDPVSVIILTLAVIHTDFVSSDGSSNWLLGVQLVGTYILIGILFFFKTV